jgi:hypothetical protein
MKNACKYLAGKPEGYKTLGRCKGRGDYNTKKEIKEVFEDFVWITLAHCMLRWRNLVDKLKILWVT